MFTLLLEHLASEKQRFYEGWLDDIILWFMVLKSNL